MLKMFATGNDAVGWGAISADCLHFFGYPITPQNEIPEWFARELPIRGGVFVQAESESSAIAMVYGAAATGVRVMTSTSGLGWSLMQEGMSHASAAELPYVVVLVQRGGPGQGTTQHAQTDFLSVTRGGGHGGYRNIVLAPASVQETFDMMQLAFHLADKYRNPVILLSDAIIGHMAEKLEIRKIDFPALPEKEWALKINQDQRSIVVSGRAIGMPQGYIGFLDILEKKFVQMKSEVRFRTYKDKDAELLIVAFGSSARASKEAAKMARCRHLRVGLFRPLTLWPFPHEELRERGNIRQFLVIEDNLGQMVEDVRCAVGDRADVHFLGVFARHTHGTEGMILPERIFEEIKKLKKVK